MQPFFCLFSLRRFNPTKTCSFTSSAGIPQWFAAISRRRHRLARICGRRQRLCVASYTSTRTAFSGAPAPCQDTTKWGRVCLWNNSICGRVRTSARGWDNRRRCICIHCGVSSCTRGNTHSCNLVCPPPQWRPLVLRRSWKRYTGTSFPSSRSRTPSQLPATRRRLTPSDESEKPKSFSPPNPLCFFFLFFALPSRETRRIQSEEFIATRRGHVAIETFSPQLLTLENFIININYI